MAVTNPALDSFIAQLGPEFRLAQVLIRHKESGFELRHLENSDEADLKLMSLSELRKLAQFTSTGGFRPLKSAPNLQTGWCARAKSAEDLEFALNQLYPGAITDWHSAQTSPPPVTDYREYTNRQTGMYRITQMLTEEQAAETIRAGC
ncbi:MAG TPA: DR2241 family protein, partial [Verrucomicrobiae bacterium]